MKRVTLTFSREQVLYDVANLAYIEGDTIATDNEHLRHQVIDIAQEGNIDRVNRILAMAHAEVVEMLRPYTKESLNDMECTNAPQSPATLRVELTLPDSFSATTVRLLNALIHEYLGCRILADWFTIATTQGAELWASKLATTRTQIHTHLPTHRPLRPF